MPRIEPQATSLKHKHVCAPGGKKKVQSNGLVCKKPEPGVPDNNKVAALNRTKTQNEVFQKRLENFKTFLSELNALDNLKELAGWDQYTNLPVKASDDRVKQIKVAAKIYHEKIISKEAEDFLNYFESKSMLKKLSDIDKAVLRDFRTEYNRKKKIPVGLVEELEEAEARGTLIWNEAHETSDYKKIIPIFEKIVNLKRKEAEYIGYKNSPYEALLSEYESDITTKELDKISEKIKRELISILAAVKKSEKNIDSDFLDKNYSEKKLKQLVKEILEHIGFDLSAGRFDISNAPFCTGLGGNDIRVTTSLDSDLIGVIAYTLHEGGHGIYAQGYDTEIKNSFIANSPSYGMDESQSRLYETIIGLGLPFWINFYPKLQKVFPGQLKNISLEVFYQAINKIEPTTVTNGNELTSPLHDIIQYEIEKDLIEGKLQVKDVPKVWGMKVEKYIGIKPKNNEEGVLQCSHWFTGNFGYFPSYLLGDIYASQIYHSAKERIGDLDVMIASGNMKVLKDWLRENIHKHGAMYSARDILKMASGEDVNEKYFIDYIKQKYGLIYGINLLDDPKPLIK